MSAPPGSHRPSTLRIALWRFCCRIQKFLDNTEDALHGSRPEPIWLRLFISTIAMGLMVVLILAGGLATALSLKLLRSSRYWPVWISNDVLIHTAPLAAPVVGLVPVTLALQYFERRKERGQRGFDVKTEGPTALSRNDGGCLQSTADRRLSKIERDR
jgi:hypothetical protein